MANRRISEFPELNGTDIDEQDLLTLVHVFEVDPTLRNKKITFTQFKDYLNLYYAPASGATWMLASSRAAAAVPHFARGLVAPPSGM